MLKLNYFCALSFPLALALVLVPQGTASTDLQIPDTPGQPHPEGGDGGLPVPPAPSDRCGNRGTEWVKPEVVQAGGPICSGAFDISIGYGPGSVSVNIGFDGCPSYIETLPGYYKAIPKPGYELVLPPQEWAGKMAAYVCKDAPGWGTGNLCVPDPASPPTDTDKSVLSYSEIPCRSIITTSK